MLSRTATLRQSPIWLLCAGIGFLFFVLLSRNILLALCALIFVGCLGVMLYRPEMGTLAVLFAIYSNIAVLAMRSQRSIEASAGSAGQNPRIAIVLAALTMLLLVPLLHQVSIGKEALVFDRGFAFMVVYLAVLLASSIFARDGKIAGTAVADYLLEGVAIYFLLTNVIRDLPTLRRAIWAILLAGCLMGGLSIFQKVTHTENRIYGGLAQIESDLKAGRDARSMQTLSASSRQTTEGGEVIGESRAAGPIGETNRYGQVLLVLLPLGVLMFRIERSRMMRNLALGAIGLIVGGLFLTLSRESVLAAGIIFIMMPFLGLLTPRHVFMSIGVVALIVLVLRPGIVARMASLEQVTSLFSKKDAARVKPDSSAIRRYVLNVAGWHVFLDHPVLGVGPGEFATNQYSSAYSNRVGLLEEIQGIPYRGHNLYLETLAETGVIGFLSLMAIFYVIMSGLWKELKRFKHHNSELQFVATAFFLSVTGYAISAVFAHLSYQRYFWLLVALASAAIRILHNQTEELAPADLLRGKTSS